MYGWGPFDLPIWFNPPTPYEFPPDEVSGDARPIALADVKALDTRTLTVEQVVAVALALVQVPKLPLSAIDCVLEIADVLASFGQSTTKECMGHEDMNEVYLELPVPHARDIKLPRGLKIASKCVELVLACKSHDQGRVDDHTELNGTYNDSHSWSEVAVVRGQAENVVPRALATRNVRGDPSYRFHVKKFIDKRSHQRHFAGRQGAVDLEVGAPRVDELGIIRAHLLTLQTQHQ